MIKIKREADRHRLESGSYFARRETGSGTVSGAGTWGAGAGVSAEFDAPKSEMSTWSLFDCSPGMVLIHFTGIPRAPNYAQISHQ
jgi:hypothetical protein